MAVIWRLLTACGAGVLGTGAGGLLGILFGRSSRTVMSCLLAFAGGVMMSIVCFDLVPEALGLLPLPWVGAGVFAGVAMVQMLGDLVAACMKRGKQAFRRAGGGAFLRSGAVLFAAIALHNLPEGLAIGSAGTHSTRMGLVLALLIALHNIPEGVSIAVPLVAGGMKRWKAVAATALSGVPTLLGGALGALLGSGGSRVVGLALALAAGAMLYVTYSEIEPQVTRLHSGPAPALSAVVGLLFGLMMVELLA